MVLRTTIPPILKKKSKIMVFFFLELFISENTAVYQCKNGFAALESRFGFVCDHIEWLSELSLNDNSVANNV
jgi:hypothetical protein